MINPNEASEGEPKKPFPGPHQRNNQQVIYFTIIPVNLY